MIQADIKKLKNNLPEGKSLRESLEEDIMTDTFSQSVLKNEKTNKVMYHLFESSNTELGYSDLTGHFSYRSSRGNK